MTIEREVYWNLGKRAIVLSLQILSPGDERSWQEDGQTVHVKVGSADSLVRWTTEEGLSHGHLRQIVRSKPTPYYREHINAASIIRKGPYKTRTIYRWRPEEF